MAQGMSSISDQSQQENSSQLSAAGRNRQPPYFGDPPFSRRGAGPQNSQPLMALDISAQGMHASITSRWRHQLAGFWFKINRDWMFNLASMLAYNLLLAVFPLLLLLVSLLGLLFKQSPATCTTHRAEGQFFSALLYALPSQFSGAGRGAAMTSLCLKLSSESFPLACIGIVTALWLGSRLFVKFENAFGVIFRLPSRAFYRQQGTAFGMAALFTVLAPFSLLLSVAPAHLLGLARHTSTNPSLAGYAVGFVCGTLVTFLLLALIYMIVPNQRVRFREIWKGALVSALLLSIYELCFPLYEHFFASSSSYGTLVGLIALMLLFFYYFTVLVLLGAEINSWSHGQQEASGDIATMLAQVNQGPLP
ncbi:MAG TPA: YihY/virulence factor BrkB family protein [Ktedonobacterales bacterium]